MPGRKRQIAASKRKASTQIAMSRMGKLLEKNG
jgi:hypothetical protein